MIDPEFYDIVHRAMYCMPQSDEGGVLIAEWDPYLSDAGKDYMKYYAAKSASPGFWQIRNGCAVFSYGTAKTLKEYTAMPRHHFLDPDALQECLDAMELEEAMRAI